MTIRLSWNGNTLHIVVVQGIAWTYTDDPVTPFSPRRAPVHRLTLPTWVYENLDRSSYETISLLLDI